MIIPIGDILFVYTLIGVIVTLVVTADEVINASTAIPTVLRKGHFLRPLRWIILWPYGWGRLSWQVARWWVNLPR